MANIHMPLVQWAWGAGAGSATRSTSTVADFLQKPDAWTGRFRILFVHRTTRTLVLKLTQPDQYHEMLELQIYSRSLTLILHDFTCLMNFCSKETRASITHLAPSQARVIRGTVRLKLISERTKLIACIATWMRLVAKGISVERDANTGRAISIDTPVISTKQRPDQAWFNFAFILLEENNKQSTLLCFDAPNQLHKEFNDLAISDEQLDDSYFVFSVILKVIWKVMDDVSWTLADVFRNIEKVRRRLWKGFRQAG